MEAEYKKDKNKSSIFKNMFTKSMSSSSKKGGHHHHHHQVAPTGCFTVYVGPEKRRFAIKTEYANHPLFKMLLEDAELEYGFVNEGPLLLPCEVDLFCKVLTEMDGGDRFDDPYDRVGYGSYGSCSPFTNPARRLGRSATAKGCASYGLLTPTRLLKINNHF